MKGILSFNLPEETEEFNHAQLGMAYKFTIDELWEAMFRPRHKHGYHCQKINKLVNTKDGAALMDELEKMYLEITAEVRK